MVTFRDKIQIRSVRDLLEYSKNNKIHTDNQISLLVEMIDKFGFTQPLLIDKNNTIIAGHARKIAAEKLGMKELPCIVIDDLTPAQIKALRIADNRIAELADNDMLNIKEEYFNLLEEEPGLEFLTGYTQDDFTDIINDENTSSKEEDYVIPEDIEDIQTDIRLGDIIKLGNHKLVCGDSINNYDVLIVGNGTIDMVFTDPPYNTGMCEKANKNSTWLNHMFEDNFTDKEWEHFMSCFCEIYYNVLKENSVAYICLDWRRSHELIPHIKKHFKFSNLIVWDKVVHGLGSDYQYTHEFIHVCKKGKPDINSHQGDDQEYQDIWRIQRQMGKDDDHATKKPLELCMRAIRHGSKQGEIVLDLFGGSGSTLIACEQLNRTCLIMELEPKYCEIICQRWEKLTGRKRENIRKWT